MATKPRVTPGFLVMMAGIFTVVMASLAGIMQSSSDLYKELNSFPLDLETGGDIPYEHAKKERVYFWLKQPNRDVEGKDFKLAILVLDANKELIKGFRRDLKFQTTRQDLDDGYYYKLGSHKFKAEFKGYIRYETTGGWLPEGTPSLLLRVTKETKFSMPQVIAILTGGVMLVLGLVMLMRDTSEEQE